MKKTNERVLLTGASGFIGHHLFKQLKSEGFIIYPVPHLVLANPRELQELVDRIQPQYIYHLAAYGNMAQHEGGFPVFQANLVNLFNLLTATKNIHYKAFVNISSLSVTLPHQTLYSATKMGGEYLCKSFVTAYNLPIVTVRPCSIYGPGEADYRFIPTVFRSCLEQEEMTLDPDAAHDWLYVDDFIRGLLLSAKKITKVLGKSIEFGWGFSTPNQVIVELIEQITGKTAHVTATKRLRTFDTDSWSGNIDDAINLLDWDPKVPDIIGLKRIYEQYGS